MAATMNLQQALTQVQKLQQLQLSDNGSIIGAPPVALSYAYINQLNFSDDKVYIPPPNVVAHFNKETLAMAKLKDNLELGHRFLSMLYSYRSVARGIPQATTQDQANRPEMYKLSFEILKPEIIKIKDLLKYCDECTTLLATVFKTMVPEYKDGFPSSEFLLYLAKTLDLILVIDVLKNAKASLNNDFSIYKRISSNLKTLVQDMEDETVEHHLLYTFLATQNVFSSRVKEKLSDCLGYDDILVDLVNTCATMYENQLYIKPEDKHMLLKAITFGLFLLDIPGEANDITKNKKLKLDRFAKILKSNPVVSFFGDMTMSLTTIFIKTPRLSQLGWDYDPNDESLMKSYLMSNHIEQMRSDYKSYLLLLRSSVNSLKATYLQKQSLTPEESEQIYNLLLRGVSLLSSFTCRVLEQSAWKYTNPTNSQKNAACPQEAKLYEMAVRYNYNMNERLVLCEVIGYIKTFASQLSTVPGFFLEAVQRHVFNAVQTFVRTTLKDMIGHVAKKKKPVLNLVQHLLSIMCDKIGPEFDDSQSRKKDTAAPTPIDSKAAGIALTQFHYIRVLLDATVNEKSKGMQGGFLKEKDFKDNHVTEVGNFLNKSYFFPGMLSFLETISECSDLSELWYREFYLELTKEIQFPIEMSLPWIIIESTLESEHQPILESVLFPFDIYNDAANRALHRLKSRYLYDEIEAEVNLCFDQFIWRLSHKIFATYRTRAAAVILEQKYRQDLEARLMLPPERHDFDHVLYSTILKQKRFYLLGRYVDIGNLITHFCNQQLRSSVDYALSRFEGADLTGIVELERLLECTRLTHRLLSEHLHLDPIDDIITECDESLSLVAFNGRIVSHFIQELVFSVFPNYSYNAVTQRFVPSTQLLSTENYQRPPQPKAVPLYLFGTKQMGAPFNHHLNLYKGFLGLPHFTALVRLIGAHQIPVLVGEVAQAMESLVKGQISPYVKVLLKGMPHSTKLPPFEYGPQGCFDYFQLVLKPIVGYSDLKSGVFQGMKEFGNSLVFFHLIDGIAKANFEMESIVSSAFAGAAAPTGEQFDQRFLIKNVMTDSNNLISPKEAAVDFKKVGDGLHGYLSRKLKFNNYEAYLVHMKYLIHSFKSNWEPVQVPREEVAIDHSNEFYRLWSCLLFAYALPPAEGEPSNRSIFGDGFLWSGTYISWVFDEHRLFKAFDFTMFLNHIKKTEKAPPVTSPKSPDQTQKVLNKFYENIDYNGQMIAEILRLVEHDSSKKEPQANKILLG